MAERRTIYLILAILLPCGFLILLTRSVLRGLLFKTASDPILVAKKVRVP